MRSTIKRNHQPQWHRPEVSCLFRTGEQLLPAKRTCDYGDKAEKVSATTWVLGRKQVAGGEREKGKPFSEDAGGGCGVRDLSGCYEWQQPQDQGPQACHSNGRDHRGRSAPPGKRPSERKGRRAGPRRANGRPFLPPTWTRCWWRGPLHPPAPQTRSACCPRVEGALFPPPFFALFSEARDFRQLRTVMWHL